MSVAEKLTAVADAIREQTGDPAKLTLDDMPDAIRSLFNQIVVTATGETIVLTDSANAYLKGLNIYGKTTQNGAPTPEAPVELVSAGDDGTVDVSVYGKNLFLHDAAGDALIPNSYPIVNGKVLSVLDNGGVIVQGNDETSNGSNAYANGWYRPSNSGKNGNPNASKAAWLTAGSVVTVSADVTVLEYSYGNSVNIGTYLYPYFTGNSYTYYNNYSVGEKNKVQQTYTITETDFYFPVITLNSAKVKIENIQIELSSTATAYEPYKVQTLSVSTPNGLPGIPVSADGNYIDSNGQQWVCDEVDFARGVYVQRVEKVELTGQGNWIAYSNSGRGVVNSFRRRFENMVDGKTMDGAKKYSVLSNYFQYGGYIGMDVPTSIGVSESKYIYFRFDGENDTIKTTQQFTEWLANKKTENIPVIVKYVLETPIETPLSAEQLAAYASLRTNYPNTTILNDDGAGMALSYVASTKNYIDNQVAAVSAAILNL